MANHRTNTNPLPPVLITIREAAPHIPCAPATLATPQWRRKWRVPTYRVGVRVLFDVAELTAWRTRRRENHDAAGSKRLMALPRSIADKTAEPPR
jgi:hypothetical protein